MWSVVLALVPAGAAGVFIFGLHALYVIIASVLAAVATEAVMQALRRKAITVSDGSVLITGLLLAYNLPPQVPLWLPVVGAFFAVAFGKQIFGGLGQNIFNPALVGRAFLMVSWPIYMTTWRNPRWAADAVSSASPLGLMKDQDLASLARFSYMDFILGNRSGCIGEVCVLALLAGAAFLVWRGYITLRTPCAYILTVGVLSWAFNGSAGLFKGDPLFFILNGGLILGAFFMATDYVTTPLTHKGKLIFGLGCGLLTFVIRRFGGYPEGVSYSILMMNAATPIIDRYTGAKPFGFIRKQKTENRKQKK
jgi:electron transport complex protein RnfD